MTSIRSQLTCNVVNDYLFAIGGDGEGGLLDSIERIFIGDMPNIASQTWSTLVSTMNTSRNAIESVAINDDIYIFGGTYQLVERLETDTLLLYEDTSLYVHWRACAVVIANRIYVMNQNNIHWSSIATSNASWYPSQAPTDHPSVIPSAGPSVSPSWYPSLAPTDPSSIPSTVPSFYPSSFPSQVPTDHPSEIPSSVPSLSPSIFPSSIPSFYPSSFPSEIPSSIPSLSPSIFPSQGPSVHPSDIPSSVPSFSPSYTPIDDPSGIPSTGPSVYPSIDPSQSPSVHPSSTPSAIPTAPSIAPTVKVPCQDAKYEGIMSPSDFLWGGESLISVNCKYLLTMRKNGDLMMCINETHSNKWSVGWDTGTFIHNYSGESVPKLILADGGMQIMEYMYRNVPSLSSF
eukprot:963394_1